MGSNVGLIYRKITKRQVIVFSQIDQISHVDIEVDPSIFGHIDLINILQKV
jgi:hypothetical protein